MTIISRKGLNVSLLSVTKLRYILEELINNGLAYLDMKNKIHVLCKKHAKAGLYLLNTLSTIHTITFRERDPGYQYSPQY